MMDQDDAAETDMAAQMGFSSFGPQDKHKDKKGTVGNGNGNGTDGARPAKRTRYDSEGGFNRGQSSTTPAAPRHALPAFNPATSIAPTGTGDIGGPYGASAKLSGEAQADPMTVAEILDMSVPGEQAGLGAGVGAGGFGPGPGPGSGGQQAYGGRSRHQHQQQRGGRRQNDRGDATNVKTNDRGDPIYYDPSFIEDPWAKLTPQPWENPTKGGGWKS